MLSTGFRRIAGIAVALLLALPAAAQDLPTLREARGLVFAEDGEIEWQVFPDASLSHTDLATLDQINQIQPQPYYGAMAIHPASGLASGRTSLAANFHDEENARAAALTACGEGCVVVMVIRPEDWQPDRALQLSAEATAALSGDYRALARRARALAISPETGQWGIGDSRAAAVAACGAPDCRVVVEG